MFGTVGMPSKVKADIRDDVLIKISEQSGEDILLQEIAVCIAEAESGLKNIPNYLYTGEKGKYTAYGIFQITRTTYREFCGSNTIERKDIEKNIECGMKILKDGGYSHWNESKYLWYGRLSKEARYRVATGQIEGNKSIVEPKVISFAGGKVKIDRKGNILDDNGAIFKEGEIPFI